MSKVLEIKHPVAPFHWQITAEEYARVQAATIREQRVNWRLVKETRRMKRWRQEKQETTNEHKSN